MYLPLFVLADRVNKRMTVLESSVKWKPKQQPQGASGSQIPSSPESAPSDQSPDQSNP